MRLTGRNAFLVVTRNTPKFLTQLTLYFSCLYLSLITLYFSRLYLSLITCIKEALLREGVFLPLINDHP